MAFPSPTLQNLTVDGTAILAVASSPAITITGGTIDGTVIGGTTPAAVHATTLSTTGAFTPASVATAAATITGGTINGTVIGGTTPEAITATTVTANSLVLTATALTLPSQTANEFFASPNGADGAPTFRSLALADLPAGVAELGATQTFTGVNTLTQGLQINGISANDGQVVLSLNGTGYNAILRNDNNSLYILLSGPTGGTFNSLRPLSINLSTGELSCDGTGVGTTFGGKITSSNFNTGIAPSSIAIGASPWTYQNTNSYGVFMSLLGVTNVEADLTTRISADNWTFVTVGNEFCYIPSGWYLKVTYRAPSAPTGASIVPI